MLTMGIDLTDKVAKESSDSTASTHEMHQEETGATSGGKASALHHQANPVCVSHTLLELYCSSTRPPAHHQWVVVR